MQFVLLQNNQASYITVPVPGKYGHPQYPGQMLFPVLPLPFPAYHSGCNIPETGYAVQSDRYLPASQNSPMLPVPFHTDACHIRLLQRIFQRSAHLLQVLSYLFLLGSACRGGQCHSILARDPQHHHLKLVRCAAAPYAVRALLHIRQKVYARRAV